MPKMNGLEATRLIMERHPTPIVIVSGSLGGEEQASFRAIEAGALAVLSRPSGMGHEDHAATVKELVQTVKLMSEVRVVKRRPRRKQTEPAPLGSARPGIRLQHPATRIRLVAIGASTGGPVALQRILKGSPEIYRSPW